MDSVRIVGVACLLALLGSANAASIECTRCEEWNEEQVPFQLFGNTYYVGTHGLSSVLITSQAGHVLIDGALPQSAPLIARHVEQLGFKMSDVKIILNSHVHYDHAGGIAELQQISGAKVIASDIAANDLREGRVGRTDPQYEYRMSYPSVNNVEALGNKTGVDLGSLHLKVIRTPGHTPGGTSWTWQSCEGERCLNVVYGDSLNAVSDDSFKYSGNSRYPTAATDLFTSIARINAAACDILIVAHPELGGLWSIFDEQGKGDRSRLVDPTACERFAVGSKGRFEERLKSEKH